MHRLVRVPSGKGEKMIGRKIEGISKSYGDKKVLDNFSMEIKEGCINSITGKSGCGKTTLLRILMGLETADTGSGDVFSGYKKSAVFQENRLCENLSVYGNLWMTAPGYTAEELETELSQIGLSGCGYQKVCELSGGMKRRVAILRALLADYEVLFLDEPFKGLDEETKQKVMDYTREKIRGKTVFLVTHVEKEIEQMQAAATVKL